MEKITTLRKRSIISAIGLLGQGSYTAILGFLAFFTITIKSGAALLGIYNIAITSISFFSYLTNLGFAAALIHKKKVTKTDLNSVFFAQLILVILIAIIGFLFTDQFFLNKPGVGRNAVYLYWALIVSFVILSLKTIPSVLLEREIQIYKLVVVQLIENTVLYVSIVILFLLNYGVMGLSIAVLLRSITGLIAITIMRPWFPSFSVSISSLKKLLSYGIVFQGNSFLALIKDDLIIFYLGATLGAEKLGFITFGKKYAEIGLRIITDNINRVAFPLFSRFQDQKKHLKKSLRNIVFYNSLLIFPFIIGSIFIFKDLLKLVPGYFDKWQPALFSFYFFAAAALITSTATPLINLFNAVGKLRISITFMTIWTILMWLLVPTAITFYGFNSVSVVFLLISLTNIAVIIVSKKTVNYSFIKIIKNILIGTIVMVGYLSILSLLNKLGMLPSLIFVILAATLSPIIYFGTITFFEGTHFFFKISRTLFPQVFEKK